MTTVLIADRCEVWREGIAHLLESHGFVVKHRISTADELIRMSWKPDWDVTLMDLDLPAPGGIEALRQVRSIAPKTPVVVFAASPESSHGAAVLREGASAYLERTRPMADLVQALRAAAEGRRYVTPTIGAALLDRHRDELPEERLTKREWQIMSLIGEGLRVQEVADKLRISASTVSTHIGNMKEKLDARSVVDLARMAVEWGMSTASAAVAGASRGAAPDAYGRRVIDNDPRPATPPWGYRFSMSTAC